MTFTPKKGILNFLNQIRAKSEQIFSRSPSPQIQRYVTLIRMIFWKYRTSYSRSRKGSINIGCTIRALIDYFNVVCTMRMKMDIVSAIKSATPKVLA